ncbi:hypothetical protein [Saccharothrix sp. HUAS TT1]|uniref:hypothetical protein n=1 Tax=unclassified Saccharothrix TaxID=2593673 RepID=UPI00345C577B
MLKKALAIVMVACATATAVIFAAGTTGAAETSRPAPLVAVDAEILASPKCSGTEGHGKIFYQVCVRYNCDSDSCFHRGYLGLINNATSPRTVTWRLERDMDSQWIRWAPDDFGVATLAAGEQRTIFSADTYESTCPITTKRRLMISYDSSGWSLPIEVSDLLACV